MHKMKKEAMVFECVTGIFITLAMMIMQVGIGLVTFVGVTLLTNGTIDVLTLLTFLIISTKIYSPLIVILTLLPEFFYSLLATKRMQALRNEAVQTGSEMVNITSYQVELNNVSFAYNKDEVLKNISLKIPENSITALVGPSGSGKTTLARLIARFWDVEKGQILIGGHDIKNIDPEKLMSYMSFVFQDVVLFNDSILNNIRIGKKDASDAEIYHAARLAQCEDFIAKMPDGYQTIIGENGSTLSGGERQRISIARALLKNAPIVLLDEATSSIDPENETQIQGAITELIKGRTVIVIAHRLRTIVGADKILVLEQGKLVEEGDGQTLLAKEGLFNRLYSIQNKSAGWSVTDK
jgi:ATP-binding cassette subfamily B protein